MAFFDAVKTSGGNCLLLGGDLSNGVSLVDDLTLLADVVNQPVYVVAYCRLAGSSQGLS